MKKVSKSVKLNIKKTEKGNFDEELYKEDEFNEFTYILLKNLEAHKITSEDLNKVIFRISKILFIFVVIFF
jgi:hypothetical protein